MSSLRAKLRMARDRVVVPVAVATADRVVEPVLSETAELRRILGNQGDAADEVAETLGRSVTRLSAELESLSVAVGQLSSEVAQLRGRLDQSRPDA